MIISFYLPQFHPIPENDAWWGRGFTEWTNVAQARPRFQGHHQPHIPADLGFYDLRLPEARLAQASLAKKFGVNGFCYYHYWFNGHLLLDKPLSDVLASGAPDFPFCVCWANENWTRAWDGLDRQVLIDQKYSEADNAAHIKWFIDVFRDSRYIRVDGKPLLLIYRIDHIPDVSGMVASWRDAVRNAGFPDLYLCAVKSGFVTLADADILSLGFDAIVDFQPNRSDFPVSGGVKSSVYRFLKYLLPNSFYQNIKLSVTANNIVDYSKMIGGILEKKWPHEYRKFPCVFPSWDNSARRKSATIIQNSDASIFGKWLKKSVQDVQPYPASERFVFINAWNEWAEGCHLEPDRKHGYAFLEQVKSISGSVVDV